MIFTFAFSKDEPEGVALFDDLLKLAGTYTVEAYLVHLVCDRAELGRRVVQDSRKSRGKITTIEVLTGLAQAYDLTSLLPGHTGLDLNTTSLFRPFKPLIKLRCAVV